MTFNEINNQANYDNDFLVFTNSGLYFNPGENREEGMYQAAHNELVASARVVMAVVTGIIRMLMLGIPPIGFDWFNFWCFRCRYLV